MLLISSISLMLAACSLTSPATPQPLPLPSPGRPWTITLTQSGGFVGVLRSIQVASDGHMTVQDQRSGRVVSQELPPDTMRLLNQLLSESTISTLTPAPPACSDCFIYDLVLASVGPSIEIHANDISIDSSGAEGLINFLGKLRDDALATSP